MPEFFASFDAQVDRSQQQISRLLARESTLNEALHGSLVTRSDNAVRSGYQVVEVNPLDLFRFLDQDAGRPEIIIKVAALSFQLGCQTSVENKDILLRNDLVNDSSR